jgi:hypothetical protein
MKRIHITGKMTIAFRMHLDVPDDEVEELLSSEENITCNVDLNLASWEDLPEKWGLIWIMENGKPRQQVGPKGNIWSSQHEFHFSEKNIQAEQAILVSALRRLQGR